MGLPTKFILTVVLSLLLATTHSRCGKKSSSGSGDTTGDSTNDCAATHCMKKIATTKTTGSPLLLTSSRLYWTQEGNIVSVPREGGNVEVLAPIPGYNLAVSETDAYWSETIRDPTNPRNHIATINTVSLQGGTASTLVDRLPDVRTTFVDDINLYWTTTGTFTGPDQGVSEGSLMSMPLGGGAVTTLYTFPEGTYDYVTFVRQRGDNIYFLTHKTSTLFSLPKTGGTPVSILSLPNVLEFYLNDTDVFGSTRSQIVKYPLDGSPSTPFASGNGAFNSLCSDGADVLWWQDGGTRDVWLGRISTGKTEVIATEPGGLDNMAADKDFVFWLNGAYFYIESARP
jgi:hypothetical protein